MKISNQLFIYRHIISTTRYKMLLDGEYCVGRDRRIPRAALQRYKSFSFEYLYLSRNNQALLNITGMGHSVFNNLIKKFKPYHHYYTFDEFSGEIREKKCYINGKQKGSKRDMSDVGCLCLAPV